MQPGIRVEYAPQVALLEIARRDIPNSTIGVAIGISPVFLTFTISWMLVVNETLKLLDFLPRRWDEETAPWPFKCGDAHVVVLAVGIALWYQLRYVSLCTSCLLNRARRCLVSPVVQYIVYVRSQRRLMSLTHGCPSYDSSLSVPDLES